MYCRVMPNGLARDELAEPCLFCQWHRIKISEENEELETEVMMLSCHLFQRLAMSDHNLREMRTCGVVKVLKACLSSKNRDLRTEAEQTMNTVLSLSDG
jgi:hypothetical protein|eukprot:COSAG02_NODE_1557_length_11939_cov_343.602872_10_plen_99_part_00